jgi:hypothetical protein
MARTTRKNPTRKRTSKKKSGFISAKFIFALVAVFTLSFVVYH